MTLYQFNALTEVGKAEILWELGVYLMARQERDHRFALYQLDTFYVEVWYHTDGHEIIKFHSFSSLHPLEPYLEEMVMPEIM